MFSHRIVNQSLSIEQHDEVLLVDVTGGAVNITIPAPGTTNTSWAGRALFILNTGGDPTTDAVTVTPTGRTINGLASLDVIVTVNGGVWLVCDENLNWYCQV